MHSFLLPYDLLFVPVGTSERVETSQVLYPSTDFGEHFVALKSAFIADEKQLAHISSSSSPPLHQLLVAKI